MNFEIYLEGTGIEYSKDLNVFYFPPYVVSAAARSDVISKAEAAAGTATTTWTVAGKNIFCHTVISILARALPKSRVGNCRRRHVP